MPDLAGWRRDDLPVVPSAPFLTVAPQWVCEVLSPSTARLDRVLKSRLYAREGVVHLWLVDPLARTLERARDAVDGTAALIRTPRMRKAPPLFAALGSPHADEHSGSRVVLSAR